MCPFAISRQQRCIRTADSAAWFWYQSKRFWEISSDFDFKCVVFIFCDSIFVKSDTFFYQCCIGKSKRSTVWYSSSSSSCKAFGLFRYLPMPCGLQLFRPLCSWWSSNGRDYSIGMLRHQYVGLPQWSARPLPCLSLLHCILCSKVLSGLTCLCFAPESVCLGNSPLCYTGPALGKVRQNRLLQALSRGSSWLIISISIVGIFIKVKLWQRHAVGIKLMRSRALSSLLSVYLLFFTIASIVIISIITLTPYLIFVISFTQAAFLNSKF